MNKIFQKMPYDLWKWKTISMSYFEGFPQENRWYTLPIIIWSQQYYASFVISYWLFQAQQSSRHPINCLLTVVIDQGLLGAGEAAMIILICRHPVQQICLCFQNTTNCARCLRGSSAFLLLLLDFEEVSHIFSDQVYTSKLGHLFSLKCSKHPLQVPGINILFCQRPKPSSLKNGLPQ